MKSVEAERGLQADVSQSDERGSHQQPNEEDTRRTPKPIVTRGESTMGTQEPNSVKRGRERKAERLLTKALDGSTCWHPLLALTVPVHSQS